MRSRIKTVMSRSFHSSNTSPFRRAVSQLGKVEAMDDAMRTCRDTISHRWVEIDEEALRQCTKSGLRVAAASSSCVKSVRR
jgi:hypothetical protein